MQNIIIFGVSFLFLIVFAGLNYVLLAKKNLNIWIVLVFLLSLIGSVVNSYIYSGKIEIIDDFNIENDIIQSIEILAL